MRSPHRAADSRYLDIARRTRELVADCYEEPEDQLVLELFVRDIARSKAFYQSLGFRFGADLGTFASLTSESRQIFLAERSDLPPETDQPVANLRIMVPDVDTFWVHRPKQQRPGS